MPKLIVQRRSGRRKLPPCGRIIPTTEPHSPFQLLIEKQRVSMDLSTRELARLVSEIQPTSQSTLWMWMHNINGFPGKRTFNSRHIQALSKVLKIPAEKIKEAIDTSRMIYRPGILPPPAPSLDGLLTLIDMLQRHKAERLSRTYVINLAKNLHNGIQYAHKPQG